MLLSPFLYLVPPRIEVSILNGRIFELSEREKLIYSILTTQFLTAEAFYVKPINFKKKTSDDIILLEENSVSKGLNRLAICV